MRTEVAFNNPGNYPVRFMNSRPEYRDQFNFVLFQLGLIELQKLHPTLKFEAVAYKDRKTQEIKYKVKAEMEEGMKRGEMAAKASAIFGDFFSRLPSNQERGMPQFKFIGSRNNSLQGHLLTDKPNRWALTIGEPMHYVTEALKAQATLDAQSQALQETDMTLPPADKELIALVPERADFIELDNSDKKDKLPPPPPPPSLEEVPSLEVESTQEPRPLVAAFGRHRKVIAGTAATAVLVVGLGYLGAFDRVAAYFQPRINTVAAASGRQIVLNPENSPPKLIDGRVKPGGMPDWVKDLQAQYPPLPTAVPTKPNSSEDASPPAVAAIHQGGSEPIATPTAIVTASGAFEPPASLQPEASPPIVPIPKEAEVKPAEDPFDLLLREFLEQDIDVSGPRDSLLAGMEVAKAISEWEDGNGEGSTRAAFIGGAWRIIAQAEGNNPDVIQPGRYKPGDFVQTQEGRNKLKAAMATSNHKAAARLRFGDK